MRSTPVYVGVGARANQRSVAIDLVSIWRWTQPHNKPLPYGFGLRHSFVLLCCVSAAFKEIRSASSSS